MKTPSRHRMQTGTSLVELMVAVGITMFIVAAAGYVYLGSRESQRALETTSESSEAGAYALQLIGRDVMNAGFYPSTAPIDAVYIPSQPRVDTYPPAVGIPARATDWIAPSNIYLAPVFGCDSAKFDHVTATCETFTAGEPDSIVLSYFTSESAAFGTTAGQRTDCTGADVGDDPSNATRKLNAGTGVASSMNDDLPPQAPLFASNFYGLNPTVMEVDKQTVNTRSLACGGNGKSPFGASDDQAYMPLLAGIDDLQLTYGVFSTEATRAPDRFYTATQVNALPTVTINGQPLTSWARVVAVRVCVMSRTLGGAPKIADKAGSLSTYLDCNDATVTQPATDRSIHKRHVQVYAVRNRLNQSF